MASGVTSIALSKPDVLGGMDRFKVCFAYRFNGAEYRYSPANAALIGQYEPIYEEVEGWAEDISPCRSFDELPDAAQRYIQYLEDLLSCPISVISTGAGRDDTIVMKDPFPEA